MLKRENLIRRGEFTFALSVLKRYSLMDVSDIRFSVAFLSRQDLLVGVNTFNMLGQVGCFSRRMFAIRAMEVALAKVRFMDGNAGIRRHGAKVVSY